MMKIKKQKNKRPKYQSVNSNQRALIIQYIQQYKYSTSHVSMITGHNISTIKAIYQVYKREGRVQKKGKRDKILNITTKVILFMADDINENFIKLGEEIQEFNSVKEEDDHIKDLKDRMIKDQLIKKQSQILSMLTNQQAVDNFTQEMNLQIEQKTLSNEFLLIQNDQSIKYQQQHPFLFSRNEQLANFSNINKISQNQDYNIHQKFLNILNEQHRLMRR